MRIVGKVQKGQTRGSVAPPTINSPLFKTVFHLVMLELSSAGNLREGYHWIRNLIHRLLSSELPTALCACEDMHRVVVLESY